MVEIIGREEQLEKFKRWINQEKCSYLVSINGRGGAGKTYLLRKIHELYSKRNDLLCLDIIDFSQSKTRTKQWLMDSIASNANESSSMPMAFETYRNKSTEFDDRKPQEDAAYLSMEELEKSFKEDFQEVEKTRRCIFLFDTFELIQDSMLSDFIIELAQQSENSLFFLAGRRNAEMDGQLKKLLGNHYQFIKLEGFDEKDAIQYIRKNHAGKKLSEQEQKALYLLADNGLPIKLALALDWLSRGLMMHTLADYSANLKDMSEAEKQNIRLAFEQELVTLISELGTKVDQAIYLMAHVNRRFNRELLNLLIPDANIETLVDAIKQLSFVKCIEDNYFVLHDELQRMIVRHVWERNDQSHEARREISQNVIEYYTQQINQLDKHLQKTFGQEKSYPEQEKNLLNIERLYYQLDLNLVDGYRIFTSVFDDLIDRRGTGIELASLSLNTLTKDRALPERVTIFVNTFYQGRILIRRQHLKEADEIIEKGLASLKSKSPHNESYQSGQKFIEQEVENRIGEIYTLRGYCHRLMGSWGSAIEFYEEACAFQQDLILRLKEKHPAEQQSAILPATRHLAEVLNDIANLQRLRGQLEKARLSCKTSLLIREALKEGRGIGHCCYVMSMIMWETGNTSESMHYLRRAREYYQKAGLVNLERGWLDRYEAYILFRTGNVARSLDLLKHVAETTATSSGLQEEHAEILLFFSRIYLEEKTPDNLQMALEKANQALELAQKINNEYRETEAYLTLCRVLLCFKDRADVQAQLMQHLESGKQLAQKNQYDRLTSMFTEIDADFAFEERDYTAAFDSYMLACAMATRYKEAVFERSLSRLGYRLQELLAIDPDQAITICKRIREQIKDRISNQRAIDCLMDEIDYIQTTAGLELERQSLTQDFENYYRTGEWEKAAEAVDKIDHLQVFIHSNRAQIWYQRALLEHSKDRFSYARLYCERAIRIQKISNAPQIEVGESYLLLSQIYWKLSNTAEAAQYLNEARQQFISANSGIGQLRVNIEQANIHLRTYQFGEARKLLAEIHEKLSKTGVHEPAYLADVLNMMARLSRMSAGAEKHPDIAYSEADKRSKKALQVLNAQNWHIDAEIYITQSILHLVWYRYLLKSDPKEAQNHLALAKENNQIGWEKIKNIQSPAISSVYRGIMGDILNAEGKEAEAIQCYLDELQYATQTKYMRLLRAMDLLEIWLVKKPSNMTNQNAQWLKQKWIESKMDQKFPEVIDSLDWFMSHRQFIPEPLV